MSMTRFEEMIIFFVKNLKKKLDEISSPFLKDGIIVFKIKVDVVLGFKAGLIMQVMFQYNSESFYPIR